MALEPRQMHLLEQLGAAVREVSHELAAYKRSLVADGFTEDEMWVLLLRMESRLLGPVVDDIEYDEEESDDDD